MLFISLCLLNIIIVLYVIYFLIQGAIYLPSSPLAIQTMLELSKVKKGNKVADLGSGDGRVAIAFAQKGALVDGYEINPLLVLISRRNIKKNNLESKINIHFQSFWGINLSGYNTVIVFGIDHIMKRLKKKLFKELKPGSKILCNLFPFPDLKPEKVQNGVFLYKKQKYSLTK